jgi:hypothetical protein
MPAHPTGLTPKDSCVMRPLTVEQRHAQHEVFRSAERTIFRSRRNDGLCRRFFAKAEGLRPSAHPLQTRRQHLYLNTGGTK